MTKCLLADCEVDLRQLPVHLGNLLSISVNFLCWQETLRQILSSFYVAARSSVKLCPLFMQADLSDSMNFHSAGRLSDNFCQLSVWSGERLPASMKFRTDRRPKSTCFNFLTHQTARIPSINFYQTSMQPDDLLLTFRAVGRFFVNSPYVVRFSVNFRQFFVQ